VKLAENRTPFPPVVLLADAEGRQAIVAEFFYRFAVLAEKHVD
jgi:hypothetical protein